MEFAQKVAELAVRSKNAAKSAQTEEATKTAVVFPFLQTLGFDVFNLDEVIPEFTADVGIKKGEKIDFGLKVGGKIAILVEAKPITLPLGSTQYSQLYRYFATLEARLAILTNGREIWFFSDIDEKNKMDKKPFFVFDLHNYDEHQVSELSRFQKSDFDIEKILDAASNLKYVKATAAVLAKQLTDPDDEFVRFIARSVYDGTVTKSVVEQLRPNVRAALDEVVRNRIQERLNVTFGKDQVPLEPSSPKPDNLELGATSDIETTDEERMSLLIVRAIAAKDVDPNRVVLRDAKSYCAILLDDNNRKPLCRLYFNSKTTRYVGLFDSDKNETKFAVDGPVDLYKFAGAICESVKNYT